MSECRSLDRNEDDFRKRSLRDACLFIGWFKIVSVMYYISLFYLVKFNAVGEFVFVLTICLLGGPVPSVMLGIMLCVGAYTNACAISAGFGACLFLATYDLIIGVSGAIYVLFIASNLYHYLMTIGFIFLALTCIPAYCHDAFIINSYRKSLEGLYD